MLVSFICPPSPPSSWKQKVKKLTLRAVRYLDTSQANYSERLQKSQNTRKRLLGTQKPYKRSISKLMLGKSLDVGCGNGRVLEWLPEGSVGVDHNPTSINLCIPKRLQAYEPKDFDKAVIGKEIEFVVAIGYSCG